MNPLILFPETINKKLRVLLGLLLICGISSCEKLSEVESKGTIRDAATLAPLDSVKVSLYEDNDDPFMGNHLLQEVTTDGSGTYKFNFTYKEGPYKIFVNRRGYRYNRTVTDKIFKQEHIFDHQEVDALDEEQILDFDMDAQVLLTIKLKNSAPANTTDQIKIEVENGTVNLPAFTRIFDGLVNMDLEAGNVNANKITRINYSVRENNVWRTFQDSVVFQPKKPAIYNLNY